MRIREASPQEAPTLTQIAHEAKRHWGYPEHWIQHWQADLTISPDFIVENEVYVAELEGQSIGFYALVFENDHASLEHLWVAPDYIGTGVGKELFVHAMQKAAGESTS
ncbi:MAG: GNAT family N-acetyltransferase [Pyrinomonadaceae bacterium]